MRRPLSEANKFMNCSSLIARLRIFFAKGDHVVWSLFSLGISNVNLCNKQCSWLSCYEKSQPSVHWLLALELPNPPLTFRFCVSRLGNISSKESSLQSFRTCKQLRTYNSSQVFMRSWVRRFENDWDDPITAVVFHVVSRNATDPSHQGLSFPEVRHWIVPESFKSGGHVRSSQSSEVQEL